MQRRAFFLGSVSALAIAAGAAAQPKPILLGGGNRPAFSVDFVSAPWLPSQTTFSRAGNAMQFDATGALTWAPANLVTYSTDFTTGWATSALAATPFVTGQSDPFGGTSASKLIPAAGSAQHYAYINSGSFGNGPSYVYSAYVKAAEYSYMALYATSAAAGAYFNLSDGTVGGNFIGAPTSKGIISVGNGWYRVYIVVPTITFPRIQLSDASGNFTVSADGASGFLIYGAQIEQVTYQTTPSLYVATSAAAYYGPRFDNILGTANSPLGLLIEEARTNAALWNRDLTNAAWTLGATMTRAKDQTGIDGVVNSASSITGGAVSATNTILQAITLASSARFQTAYVKRLVGSGVVNMTTDGGATWTAISPAASWTRVSIPTQTLANPSVGFQIMTNGDSIAVDFVQNENGVFATSPIFTTTAAATRAKEVTSSTNPALLALGAWIVETGEMNAGTAATMLGISTGIGLGATAANALTTAWGGAQTTANTTDWTGINRSGIAFGPGRVALALNGGAIATAANSPGTPSALYPGSTNNGASGALNGHIRKIKGYRSLTDTALTQKTAAGSTF